MKRVRVELPAKEKFIFTTEIVPRISDINYGNHLGHDRLVSLLHEARVRFLAQHGFSEMDAGGASLILADLAVVYRAEVKHGQTLAVAIALDDASGSGLNFYYKVTRKDDAREVARAVTGIVFFDYQKKRVTRMPKAFSALLT